MSSPLDLGFGAIWHAGLHSSSILAKQCGKHFLVKKIVYIALLPVAPGVQICPVEVTLTESANHYRAAQHPHASSALDMYFSSSCPSISIISPVMLFTYGMIYLNIPGVLWVHGIIFSE